MAVRHLRADSVDDVRAEHGEGPAWDERAALLLWVDMLAGGLHRTRGDGSDEVTDYDQPVCVAVPRAGGGLALALGDGLWLEEPGGERRRLYAIPQPDGAGPIRMNDGKCDPQGRLWAGSMAYDARPAAGALYRLDRDLTVHEIVRDVTISNGLTWTPDGTTMYYIDTPTGRVDAFDADPATGAVRDRRPAVEIPEAAGGPDGMTIDDEGCLWVALWGGSAVHRYTPDGRLDTVVSLPCDQVTSCAFGGSGLGELWITTSSLGLSAEQIAAQPLAGNLFVLRPGVTGPAAVAFAG
jgi:sugar lactone lactonase YvrE